MQNSTTSRRARRLGSALVLSGLMAVVGGFATPAHAATGDLKPYEGNFKCADVAPKGETWLEYKLDGWAGADENGLHDDDPNGLEITISNATDKTFDWTSNLDIAAVLVKGGPGGNYYGYPGAADLFDTGLMAPINTDGGDDVPKTYAISHVSFCWSQGDDTPGEEIPGPKCVDGHLPTGEPCDDTPGEDPGDGCKDPLANCDLGIPEQKPDCVDHPQEVCDQGTPGGGGDNPGGGGDNPGGGGDNPGGGGDNPGGEQPKDVPIEPQDVKHGTEVLGERLEQGTTLPRTGVDSSVLAAAGALLVSLGMTTKVASRLTR